MLPDSSKSSSQVVADSWCAGGKLSHDRSSDQVSRHIGLDNSNTHKFSAGSFISIVIMLLGLSMVYYGDFAVIVSKHPRSGCGRSGSFCCLSVPPTDPTLSLSRFQRQFVAASPILQTTVHCSPCYCRWDRPTLIKIQFRSPDFQELPSLPLSAPTIGVQHYPPSTLPKNSSAH